MRPASTGRPRRSARSKSTPASSSSERLKPAAGCTRFIPDGYTGRGRTVTLPGTPRQFVKLLPIAFVPSVHRSFTSPFLDAAKARQGSMPGKSRIPFSAPRGELRANCPSYSLQARASEGNSSPGVSNTSTREMFRSLFLFRSEVPKPRARESGEGRSADKLGLFNSAG